MELERVARRLAVDQGYRRRAAEGLRAAGGGAGASGHPGDVLLRVRRLNDYLNGLAILDDDEPAAPAGPLPWEKPPTPAEQPPQLTAQLAPSAADSSPEDSDIEEEGGAAGQDDAQAVAALLAEAQAAVQRRRGAAALTIQCAYRRHRAQALLRQLRERRLAADRLVARALAAAYEGVCGSRRTLALRAALRHLQRWRRRRLRQRLWRSSNLAEAEADGAEAEAAEQQEQLGQAACAMASPATDHAPEPPGQPGAALPAQQSPSSAQPAPAAACSGCQTDGPPAAPHLPATERPTSGRRVGTPPTVFIAVPGPPPLGFLPAGGQCSSSGGGSSRGSTPVQQQPWQQRQASPLSQARTSSGGSGAAQGCPTAPLQQRPSPPRTASGLHSSSSRKELYRRSSSIQLLEAVQLGIDGAGGSVASQAALAVCERVQQRVQELQRSASQGRPITAGSGGGTGHRIGRVGSGRTERQASSRAWGGEAIPE